MEACNFPVHAFTMHLTANQRLACPICLLENSQFEVKSDTNLMNHLQSVHGDMEPRKLEFSGVRQASQPASQQQQQQQPPPYLLLIKPAGAVRVRVRSD